VILGAGPAGLGAALQMAKRGFQVTVMERAPLVGGNAASFDFHGFRADYGSHRLHPSCTEAILSDIRSMLGSDLLDRPRHGRIYMQGRWLHFPLKPLDLLRNAPVGFLAGAAKDTLTKVRTRHGQESFATVLEKGLGPTICRDFYFPYARKIWGTAPEELDAEQARRRVSASSPAKLVKKILSAIPGIGKGGARFFYPRNGFGQISEAYRDAAVSAGARVLLNGTVEKIQPGSVTANGETHPADLVISTIPITQLAKRMVPSAPAEIIEAAERLKYRSMILIYLLIQTDSFTEFDAHYFPSPEIGITRLSEPKHYGLAHAPGRTFLCAELPCSPEDPVWSATDAELAELVKDALGKCGLPVTVPVLEIATRRIPQAYPIYEMGFQKHFKKLDAWLTEQPGVLSLGRQGLFAHDNTHHTLAMAYAAAACIGDDAVVDQSSWALRRKEFEAFVVED